MMRVTIGEISKKSMFRTNRNFEKFENNKSYIHYVRHVGNDDLNYVGHCEHDAHHHRRNFGKVNVQNKQEFRKV